MAMNVIPVAALGLNVRDPFRARLGEMLFVPGDAAVDEIDHVLGFRQRILQT